MTQQVMQWQLVGRGDVVVLTVPGDIPVSVAISDAEFVKALDMLTQQAQAHPNSSLRYVKVETGGR